MSRNQRLASAGEFRSPVRVTHLIGSPVEALWSAISARGNLELCHPFCDANPVSAWPGAESCDEIRYLNGRVYQRRFVDWQDGVGYDLVIEESGRDVALVTWRVKAASRTSSSLTITVRPVVSRSVPRPMRRLVHPVYVRPMLRRYLKSVVRGFDWYLTRGIPVPRNRFGSHPWFST